MIRNRRNFLRGSAAALTGLGMGHLMSRRAIAASSSPKRVIFWYVPEGCEPSSFWPSGGTAPLNINLAAQVRQPTYCLQPLKPFERDLTLIKGFDNNGSAAADPHQQVVDGAVAGSRQAGLSLDQVLGEHLQGPAAFHVVVSSVFGRHAHSAANYLCPVRMPGGSAGAPTWNPVTTYNQLFPNGIAGPGTPPEPPRPNHSLQSKLALMGSVRQRLAEARCQGGAIAQARMESYLASVERIEAQTRALIDADMGGGGGGGPAPDVRVTIPGGWENTNNTNKYWQDSDNFRTLVRIQIDTTIAALALDRTRVSFMQFSASGNDLGVKSGLYDGLHYRKTVSDLEGSGALADHAMGHAQDDMTRRNQAKVFRWYYSELAYLIGRLKEIPDGAGTLFDSTLVFCCTEYGSTQHKKDNLPYILVGNPGGKFKNKGMFLSESGRNHADLLLGIARGMGMTITRFADSSTPYSAILA